MQRIEDRMHEIDRKLLGKDIRLSGTIKVSTTDTLGYYWLPPYIRQFKDEYPNIVIDVDAKVLFVECGHVFSFRSLDDSRTAAQRPPYSDGLRRTYS